MSISSALMPVKGTSRQTDRDCLVCGETTQIAHLGIDTCRACAVFYRRARTGHDFVCRSGTGNCSTGKSLNCKRCRYDRIVELLERSELLCNVTEASQKSVGAAPQIARLPATGASKKSARSLLQRVSSHYDSMCFNRLSSELNNRADPPHPLKINLETGPFYYADFDSLIRAVRMLLTASLEFGRTTFPEFGGLTESEKWTMATNFFYRFRVFEGCYRANKIFPNEIDKYFLSYSAYCNVPIDEEFLKTAPAGSDTAGCVEFLRSSEMRAYLTGARELIARVDPCREEFLVVLVLMFWFHGDASSSDSIMRICDKYRAEILKELHDFYREEMGLDDYAARIGELMMLTEMFERKQYLTETFEVIRMFNIVTDDNFVYQLQKDLTIS